DPTGGMRPPARPDHRRLRGRPRAVGLRLDLVRHAAVADRGLPSFRHPRRAARTARLCAADPRGKEQIFGLNAARLFRVNVAAKRNELPKDYLSQMKMVYLDEGATPSHRWYGWVAS